MLGSENVKILDLVIDADPTGEEEIHWVKFPRAATIKAGYVVSELTQNAGTAALVRLENWGTAGTAVAGTICAYVGGTATASVLTAQTPVALTIDTAQDYLAQGTWLVVHYNEEGAGWVTGDRLTICVHYLDGVGA